jgi:hypothetical protein
MKKSILLFIVFLGSTLSTFAQNETSNDADAKKGKMTDHYIGVQLNSLIKQVFNFNNGVNPAATNPYLLTYNMNSRKTGWGFRIGINANFGNSSSTNLNVENSASINDIRFRVGVEKAYKLSRKWTAGAGIDLLFNNNNDEMTSNNRSFYDTASIVTKTLFTSYGGGAMGWLRYNITERILVGTEASYYYTTGQETITIDQTTIASFQTIIKHTSSKPTISHASLNLPIAFYLSVKF